MSQRRLSPALVTALAVLTMAAPIATDLYTPGFPAMAEDLGSDPGSIQLTLALFMVGMAAGQPLWGPLSDAVGRRGPLAVGASAFVVSSVLVAVVDDVRLVIALRFLQGFAGCAGVVIGRAIARDLTTGAELARLLSIIAVVQGIAPIAAPVLGGTLVELIGWRGTLGVLAVFAVVTLLLALLVIPESLAPERRVAGGARPFLATAAAVLRDIPFLGYAGVSAFAFASAFAFIAGSSVVLQDEYGLTPQQFGLSFAVNALGMMLVGALNARFVVRFGPARLLTAGLAAMTIGAVLLAVLALATGTPPLPALLALVLLTTATLSSVLANSSSLALARHARGAGTASAVLGTAQYAVGGLIAPAATVTGQASATAMAAAMAGCAVLACAALVVARRADAGAVPQASGG